VSLSAQRLLKIGSCLLGAVCGASSHSAELNLEFFPGLESHSEEVIRLRGLADLYPNTIWFEDPKLETRSLRDEAARIEELPREITYARVYRLDEAVSAIREVIDNPALIIDMRYLQSESSGIALASLLNSDRKVASVAAVGDVTVEIKDSINQRETIALQRSYPAIVLCNRETAGPFEAILHALQANGCIIAVGEATAGRTGYYKQSDTGAWIIAGEIRPSADVSILASGFVPRIEIEATPESNYLSYHLFEAGTPIARLLRNDAQKQAPTPKDDDDSDEKEDEDFEPDAVLQRGVDIVAALQVLEQLPENK